MQDPIVVLGAHKSGSSLVRSLLDGHPQLSVLPREPHYFERSGLEVRYPLRRTSGRSSTHEEFGRLVARELEREAADTNPYSDSPGWAGYSGERFMQIWQASTTTDLASRYVAYLAALWASATDDQPHGAYVDKSTEYVEFVSTLRSWFPSIRFIHVIRNPYANLVGIRRYYAKTGGTPRLRAGVRSIAMSLSAAAHHSRATPGYYVVRLEDLVGDTESAMRGIAAHLGIPFCESLLTPTIEGRPWMGNSVDDVRRPEVRAEPSTQWRNELHAVDVGLVNAAVDAMATFAYDRLQAHDARYGWQAALPGETRGAWLWDRGIYLARRLTTRPPHAV